MKGETEISININLYLTPLHEPRKGETAKGETETKSLAKGETSRLSHPLRARQGNYGMKGAGAILSTQIEESPLSPGIWKKGGTQQ